MSWPYIEDDFMEIGNSGWVAVGENFYKNMINNHTIDKDGIEYDAQGNIVYDPREELNDNKN